MRPTLLVSLLAAVSAPAAPVFAQAVDRYGGVGAYAVPAPQQAPARTQPERVLTWSGKTIPAAPPQAAGYGYPAYAPQGQPAAYGGGQSAPTYPAAYAQPAPQAYAPPRTQPYASPRGQPGPLATYPPAVQAQPYYAPAPAAPSPPPGSTATAPNGVYPPNTVPPQLAYPMAAPPQMTAPLVNDPQLPTSIYGPPVAAAQRPRQPQAAAATAAAPVRTARLYSVHREFGMQPDRTPPPVAEQGQPVELVSSIDSGPGPDPAAESGTTVRTRQTDSKGATVTRTAQLRGGSPDN